MEHENYLYNFNKLFIMIDTQKKGILDQRQFKTLLFVLLQVLNDTAQISLKEATKMMDIIQT